MHLGQPIDTIIGEVNISINLHYTQNILSLHACIDCAFDYSLQKTSIELLCDSNKYSNVYFVFRFHVISKQPCSIAFRGMYLFFLMILPSHFPYLKPMLLRPGEESLGYEPELEQWRFFVSVHPRLMYLYHLPWFHNPK